MQGVCDRPSNLLARSLLHKHPLILSSSPCPPRALAGGIVSYTGSVGTEYTSDANVDFWQLRHGGELQHLGDRLLQIASARHFARSDFVGAELLSKEDWMELRESSWELRRAYAMAHFVALLRRGVGVHRCSRLGVGVRRCLRRELEGVKLPSGPNSKNQFVKM